jgi:hypothetical protein
VRRRSASTCRGTAGATCSGRGPWRRQESSPDRRYPTYYAAHNGHLSKAAQRLVTQQQSHVIEISGTNEFLGDLVDRVRILAERSQRRAAPRRLRSYSLAPSSNSTPMPWAATPMLTIRTVATVGPADSETTRRIGPAERRRLIAALNESRVTRRLRELALKPLGSRQADPTVHVQGDVSLDGWIATLDPTQTTDHATYRLGGDCSSGIAAIFEVRTPVLFMSGGSVTFILRDLRSISAEIACGHCLPFLAGLNVVRLNLG